MPLIAEIPFDVDTARILAKGKIAAGESGELRKVFESIEEKVFA